MAKMKSGTEFKIDDIIMQIGGNIRYTITGVLSDWYNTVTDSPPARPWVLKRDARKEFVKVGKKRRIGVRR